MPISPINMYYLFKRTQQRKASETYLQLSQQEVKTKQTKEKSLSPRSSLAFCMRSSARFSIFLLFAFPSFRIFLGLLSIFAFNKHVLWMNLLVHRARYEFECKEGTVKREPCETENVVSRRIVYKNEEICFLISFRNLFSKREVCAFLMFKN